MTTTEAITSSFLEFHRDSGFSTPDQHPLVIDDPTVLFVNATITPYKAMFRHDVDFVNFALIQKCLRLGGTGGNIDTPRGNTNYTSLFHMLGSGLFEVGHDEAVTYFVDMLQAIGLERRKVIYSAVGGQALSGALEDSGIETSQLRILEDPNEIQHDWSFGEGDLHGSGIIAWYNPEEPDKTPELSDCIQIGRLVHIDGISQGEAVSPFPYTAFDMGLGMSRIELALTGDSREALEPWRVISRHFRDLFPKLSNGDAHYLANLCRVIDELTMEGVRPGNKKQAYVLRKIVRTLIEETWLNSDNTKAVTETLHFLDECTSSNSALTAAISSEETAMRAILSKSISTRQKNPTMSDEELHATFGIKPSLLKLVCD